MSGDRAEAMADAYRAGDTLAAIGLRFGVTRERVRQLINTRVTAGEAMEARQKVRAEEVARDRAFLLTVAAEDPSRTFREVYEEAGVTEWRARELFTDTERASLFGRTPVSWMPTIPDEDVYASLRAAAGDLPAGRLLSAEAYGQSSHAVMSPVRVVQRWGTWAAAMAAAGLECNPPRRVYARAWSDDDLMGWVVRFVRECPGGSFAEFGVWCRGLAGSGAPSSQTVRNRLGGWVGLRNTARVVLVAVTPG